VPKHLLVVDDDPAVRRSLGLALEEEGLKISSAANAAEGLAIFAGGETDVVVLDLFLPDAHGLDVLKAMRAKDPDAAVIVVTASDDIRDAVQAMKQGALEYLVKPYNLEALKGLIQHALSLQRSRLELGAHRKELSDRYTFEAIERGTPAFAAVIDVARRLAQSPTVTLLIEGETGVGKEFLARAVHYASGRAEGPFTAISCAAIPDTLLESELFGHEAGAFTDAKGRKKGLFELAEGGTLLLDEIGEMAPAMQAKLLRVIETKTFRRVGGTEDITVDARLMAATNVILEDAVAAKRFREDLYYRLKVGHLRLPPLRERTADIVPLAHRLLAEACREMRRRPPGLSTEVQRAFTAYRWPGNVRELRNVLERAVILKDGPGDIDLVHLPPEFHPGAPAAGGGPGSQALADVEREHILRVVKALEGNHTRAAKQLGISRTTLWEKLKLYKVDLGS